MNVAFTKAFPFAAKTDAGKGSPKNSGFQILAFGAEVEHSREQSGIGHIRVAGRVLAILWPFRQHVVIGPADLVHGVPKTKRHSRTHNAANSEWLGSGKDLARNKVVLRVFVVRDIRDPWQILHGKYRWIELWNFRSGI